MNACSYSLIRICQGSEAVLRRTRSADPRQQQRTFALARCISLLPYTRMANDQIISFSSPTFSKVVKWASLLLLLLGFLTLPIGVVLILFPIYAYGAHGGAEINLADRSIRHFGAWFFMRWGKWGPLSPYERIIVLSRGVRVTRANELGVERKRSYTYHEVHLTDRAHRTKFLISEHSSRSSAVAAAKELSIKLAFPLDEYSPERTTPRR